MSLRPAPGPGVVVPRGLSALAPFVDADVFGSFEVQLAATVLRLQPDVTADVLVALALAARAPRFGHVCAELDRVVEQIAGSGEDEGAVRALPWPAVGDWARALSESSIVATPGEAWSEPVRPLVCDGTRVYLQRYWHYESAVAGDLSERARRRPAPSATSAPGGSGGALVAALDALFGPEDGQAPDLQREAARRALTEGVSIIAGGPGTGKTHTIARLLVAAHLVAVEEGRDLKVALAAPTGKAAAQMGQAVKAEVLALEVAGVVGAALSATLAATEAMTVHRLLGWRPGTRFRHDRSDPLVHDLVIVDETSMVSLPLMAKLLDAVRPESSLVLVGDPFQLASIEAGTVMGDVVGPAEESGRRGASVLDGRVTVLRRMRRFAEGSTVAALAEAVRTGDADGAREWLGRDRADVQWVRDDDAAGLEEVHQLVVAAGIDQAEAALGGDALAAIDAAHRIKVLTATRRGPRGLYDWSDRIEAAVADGVPALRRSRRWYVGQPVIVTGNDPINRVFNGDAGVVVGRDGGVGVAFLSGEEVRYLPPSRLDRVETWWAMTIHKSQGSEFSHAVVSLPESGSPILTRELLYTAVTRAKERLTIVSSEASLRAAIGRPIARASGLRDRLWPT